MSATDRIARLHIRLDQIEPPIWRRVEVPVTCSLKALHDVIQTVMLFEDYHLFSIDIDDRHYGIPDPEWDHMRDTRDAGNARLGTIVARGVSAFSHTYDFGDDWRHTITVEAIGDADPASDYPRLLEGARRTPPEDVGGLPGFEMFLEAMADPSHKEHRNLRRWYGRRFDPQDIDPRTINQRLGKLARRRAIGKAAFERSRNRTN